ncbi:hypothetical protein EI94DRAFT_1699698 [Lactarius quietus]|nr:hypothetical protein EI94DRAFT_1699698 [Lactarius quietus]
MPGFVQNIVIDLATAAEVTRNDWPSSAQRSCSSSPKGPIRAWHLWTNAGEDQLPRIKEVWMHAMNHISHPDLASQESSSCFMFPSIHLFWGCEPQNQRMSYYHYLLFFNDIKNRSERDLLALTTQGWGSILGNTYWTKQWPKHNGMTPTFGRWSHTTFIHSMCTHLRWPHLG